MSESPPPHRKLPSDITQIPIVWSYELLKYFRSWRLVASVIIVVAMLALLYVLPPALGRPYSGTDSQVTVWVQDFGSLNLTSPGMPTPYGIGILNKSVIATDSLVVYRDGTLYSSANGTNWIFTALNLASELPSFMGGMSKVNALLFLQNVSGSVITATYEWSTSSEDFSGIFLAFASILVIIAATFFAADAIVGEFQNRTGYLVFPTPLRRWALFMGKFAASMTAGLMVVSLFYAGTAALSFVAVGGVDDDFLLSYLFAVEFLWATTAVAYLISSVLKGSTGATVLTFLMFIVILPIVDSVSTFAGVKIDASLTFVGGIITFIVVDPYPVDSVTDQFGFTFYMYYPEPWVAAIVCLAYAVIGMAVSMFLFNRKQLTG